MKNKQQIENAAEQTLKSLDGMQAAEANEFLHAKIMHRLQNRQPAVPVNHTRLMLRLSLALGLFLCLNITSYLVLSPKQHKGAPKSVSGSDAFAEAYQLNNQSYSY